ncbi:regulatory protein RecX [Butyrivibrio sp. CB08]|uniref:regulatory protein RecX n=1 Tax=Butyrivibrio sp. CB08 TaxID=2364879 RepID=UPI000EA86F96|nr:regulatory protein RecX [Butyrivibrio sp. CB08]RKM57574.1 regulatory protein RecX [Butyrivibrio sp. CB08]
MTITDIVELDKKRNKIFIDGEFAFVLYKGELKDFGIKTGAQISDATYKEIVEGVLYKRCKLRAMNLLQKKDYTVKQLRDKLAEGLYAPDIIDDAIGYVKMYKYLDDDRYARDYITYHMSTRSKNRIIQDLMKKGISKEDLLPIMEELYSEESGDVELEQVRALLDKKHYDPDTTDFKEKQKIMAFLVRRGFQMSTIRKAMDCYDEA